MDNVDSRTRSRMMAAIRSRNTAPELSVRSYLHACGLRFRVHARGLPGSPDIVLPGYRAVVFVHGCFWHRHQGCPFATMPSTRPEFWQAKFAANVARDTTTQLQLESAGWRVFTIWECEVAESRLEHLFWQIVAGPV